MARKSSFSSNRSSSRQSTTQTAPKPTPKANPPQQAQPQAQSQGFFSSMMGTMATGMAFGAGSEVAHQAVRGMMGSNSHSDQVKTNTQEQVQQVQTQSNVCQMENSNFIDCLKFNSNNITSCQDYLNLLKSCEQKFK